MKSKKGAVLILLLFFGAAMVFEACGTTKGKSCKPPRKRYYHHTFIDM
ncbi:MAG: hypothetical protein ACKO67_02080 [Bacteroidota bacterium]